MSGDDMHPFLYPELVDAIRDDRIRYRRGRRLHDDRRPARRGESDF